ARGLMSQPFIERLAGKEKAQAGIRPGQRVYPITVVLLAPPLTIAGRHRLAARPSYAGAD
ncbi:MAG: hypothetical protein ABWX93_09330, partial [Pseudoxanthomonas sp.]